ncbi:MAG: DnaB-like helicase N-terminal domain-containing protein, partial [Peptostreptococcaceae bacterium]
MNDSLRTMPQNVEAEQSVIGSMLIDKNAIAQVAEVLQGDDFYKDSHKAMFNAIKDLYNKDVPVDMITLVDYLKSNDMLEKAGGITYITEISMTVPSTANLTSYIKIVEDKSTLRRLIRSSTEIIENSYNKQDNVESVIDLAEKNIFNISEKRSTSDFEPMSVVLERGFLEIEKIFNNKGQINGVASGFIDLDSKTSGFQSGDMVLIAARPSMGKTTL